jgi:hypothetical protein
MLDLILIVVFRLIIYSDNQNKDLSINSLFERLLLLLMSLSSSNYSLLIFLTISRILEFLVIAFFLCI